MVQRFVAQNKGLPFPQTGDVRWFIVESGNDVHANSSAPLTIKGRSNVNNHVVVELANWQTHAPVAIIPVRGGETATLQIPFGRYRLQYAPNASWQGDGTLVGDTLEAVEPMDFYRKDNQTVGHKIDLNERVNGNLKTRRTSFF